MIATLSGKLTHKSPAYVVLETGGVGYGVHISLHTWDQIQHLDTCRLHTHLHVKEDAHTLYGFYAPDERALFLDLISVSGIGPGAQRIPRGGVAGKRGGHPQNQGHWPQIGQAVDPGIEGPFEQNHAYH
jgi:hypothetical protein